MGYRKPYTLLKIGKIWYYRTYDEDGIRTYRKSTGQINKSAAHQYVINLIKEGRLISKKSLLFKDFAEDFWVWDKCSYIKNRLARKRRISRTYVNARKTYLTHHILPYFKDMKLSKITPRKINDWMMELFENPDIHISPTTINQCLTTLRIMLGEAKRLGYIINNPAKGIEGLGEQPKQKSILTIDEMRSLFNEDRIDEIWGGNLMHYTMNLLSAATGMRQGEILGLQRKCIYIDYVDVKYGWERKYGLKNPKWDSSRVIPIPGKVSDYLQMIMVDSPYKKPDDLVFYGKDRDKPVYYKTILDILYQAFEKIGISKNMREKRNVTFHSWRHFFNTYLRNHKIPDAIVQKITGHRTKAMLEHYTHVDLSYFDDVKEVQEGLFA